MIKHKQSEKGIRSEHLCYLKKIGFVIILSIAVGWMLYSKYKNTGNDMYFNFSIIISLGLLGSGIILVLKNYLPFIRYSSSEDYIEIDKDYLWITTLKLNKKKEPFPLINVKEFIHSFKPKESIELITDSGEEIYLEGYEDMHALVNDLLASSAGSKYHRK